jgi:hypothetical protein
MLGDMPLPTDKFRAQARRAGRTVSWRIEAAMICFLAAFIGLLGLLLFSSALWFGILALLLAFTVAGYGIYRVTVGRRRDIICPICGATGEVFYIQQSYQFHCPHCDMTADTGVSSHGGGAYGSS